MESSLSKWCKVKESLAESNHKPPYFKEGDVWWVCVGMNVGSEVYGKGRRFTRPVLVIKKYNKYFFTGIPLSTKIKDNKYNYPVDFNSRKVSVLLSQVRSLSVKRLECKLGEFSDNDFTFIKKELLERVL